MFTWRAINVLGMFLSEFVVGRVLIHCLNSYISPCRELVLQRFSLQVLAWQHLATPTADLLRSKGYGKGKGGQKATNAIEALSVEEADERRQNLELQILKDTEATSMRRVADCVFFFPRRGRLLTAGLEGFMEAYPFELKVNQEIVNHMARSRWRVTTIMLMVGIMRQIITNNTACFT